MATLIIHWVNLSTSTRLWMISDCLPYYKCISKDEECLARSDPDGTIQSCQNSVTCTNKCCILNSRKHPILVLHRGSPGCQLWVFIILIPSQQNWLCWKAVFVKWTTIMCECFYPMQLGVYTSVVAEKIQLLWGSNMQTKLLFIMMFWFMQYSNCISRNSCISELLRR